VTSGCDIKDETRQHHEGRQRRERAHLHNDDAATDAAALQAREMGGGGDRSATRPTEFPTSSGSHPHKHEQTRELAQWRHGEDSSFSNIEQGM